MDAAITELSIGQASNARLVSEFLRLVSDFRREKNDGRIVIHFNKGNVAKLEWYLFAS